MEYDKVALTLNKYFLTIYKSTPVLYSLHRNVCTLQRTINMTMNDIQQTTENGAFSLNETCLMPSGNDVTGSCPARVIQGIVHDYHYCFSFNLIAWRERKMSTRQAGNDSQVNEQCKVWCFRQMFQSGFRSRSIIHCREISPHLVLLQLKLNFIIWSDLCSSTI